MLFVSGPEGLRGSTGVVSSGPVPFSFSKFIHVDVTPKTAAGAGRSPVTGPGRHKLELQIATIFDSHDSHGSVTASEIELADANRRSRLAE